MPVVSECPDLGEGYRGRRRREAVQAKSRLPVRDRSEPQGRPDRRHGTAAGARIPCRGKEESDRQHDCGHAGKHQPWMETIQPSVACEEPSRRRQPEDQRQHPERKEIRGIPVKDLRIAQSVKGNHQFEQHEEDPQADQEEGEEVLHADAALIEFDLARI